MLLLGKLRMVNKITENTSNNLEKQKKKDAY